jgi:hypothetical protein
VEVSGILITFNRVTDLAALFPEGKFSFSHSSKDGNYYRAQPKLGLVKRTAFFNMIEKINDNLAIYFLLRDAGFIFLPSSKSSTCIFQLGRKDGSGVIALNRGAPSIIDDVTRTSGLNPMVFEPKNSRFGNGSGNIDFKGDMIRSSSSQGREHGARESSIPSKIDEGSIKSLKSGRRATVGPSELSIKKGKLDEGQLIDTVVESLGLHNPKIVIILFMGETDHVEVAGNDPGGVLGRSNRKELVQESRPKIRRRRSIDISKKKGDVGGGHGEVDRDRMGGGRTARAGERAEGPSGKNATRAPRGISELQTIQAMR